MSVMVFEPVSLRASPALRVDEAALASVTAIDESSNVGQEVSRVDCRRVRLLRRRLPGRLRLGESPSIEASPQSLHCLPDDRAEITVGHLRSHQGAQPLEVVANLRIRGELDFVATMKQPGCQGDFLAPPFLLSADLASSYLSIDYSRSATPLAGRPVAAAVVGPNGESGDAIWPTTSSRQMRSRRRSRYKSRSSALTIRCSPRLRVPWSGILCYLKARRAIQHRYAAFCPATLRARAWKLRSWACRETP
jgi:hypothetical protein